MLKRMGWPLRLIFLSVALARLVWGMTPESQVGKAAEMTKDFSVLVRF